MTAADKALAADLEPGQWVGPGYDVVLSGPTSMLISDESAAIIANSKHVMQLKPGEPKLLKGYNGSVIRSNKPIGVYSYTDVVPTPGSPVTGSLGVFEMLGEVTVTRNTTNRALAMPRFFSPRGSTSSRSFTPAPLSAWKKHPGNQWLDLTSNPIAAIAVTPYAGGAVTEMLTPLTGLGNAGAAHVGGADMVVEIGAVVPGYRGPVLFIPSAADSNLTLFADIGGTIAVASHDWGVGDLIIGGGFTPTNRGLFFNVDITKFSAGGLTCFTNGSLRFNSAPATGNVIRQRGDPSYNPAPSVTQLVEPWRSQSYSVIDLTSCATPATWCHVMSNLMPLAANLL
jgi:hypothetical protein